MSFHVYGTVLLMVTLLALQVGCAYEQAYPRTDSGAFEIKKLPASRVLVTQSEESYFDNSNALFSRLFSYIDTHDIPMTVPVEMRKIPATMIFFVGSEASQRELESADEVSVTEFPERLVASHGARGSYTAANFQESAKRLREWLEEKAGYRSVGSPYAVYWHGPFRPGFLKRYEVHLPVEKTAEKPKAGDLWIRRPEAKDEALDLGEFKWENRLLLVFASDVGMSRLGEFRSALEKKVAGVLDRDLLLIPILRSKESSGDATNWQNATALRKNYGAAGKDFLVVLVGKDGTEKQRWTEVPQVAQIFEIIDAMPMRRREMRERDR